MVPLAQAIADRGHDVLWATPADGVEHVERIGIPAVAAGPAGLPGPVQVMQRFPELEKLGPAEIPEHLFGKMFGAIAAPAILDDLRPLAQEWRPEMVICDQAELAGHIAAAELGIPSITKGFGPLLPERRVARAADEVAPLWQGLGLEPRPYAGCYDTLYLDIYPPELELGAADHVGRRQLLSPFSDDGRDDGCALPMPGGPDGAPLVYVTMGTVFANPGLLELVVRTIATLDVRVLVTIGPGGDPADLGAQPEHVRVERYVPQNALLPHCAAVVSHGGSGTTLGAARYGVPQLLLPQGADQFHNGAAVTMAGAGLSLSPAEVTAEAVRDAVGRLLDEPSFRESAERVSTSIAAMPSAREVAALLESLV
jgi:UDP:flavonoid glycosyltransferase YjiC (YdhE family)